MAKPYKIFQEKITAKPCSLNHLYYGDNLEVLHEHIASESVDLTQLPHFGFPNARKPAEMLGSHWVGMNCGAKLFGGVKSEIYCAHRRDPIL